MIQEKTDIKIDEYQNLISINFKFIRLGIKCFLIIGKDNPIIRMKYNKKLKSFNICTLSIDGKMINIPDKRR